MKNYQVTVTPRITVYAGTWQGGEYTAEVVAKNAKEAISKVRAQRRAEDGRFTVPADYRASVVEAPVGRSLMDEMDDEGRRSGMDAFSK